MTDLRTAAQQALEALEYHVEQTRPIHRTSEAITALRAALAQQADTTDPGHDVDVLREHVRHLERRIRELHAQQAEPAKTFLITGNEFCGAPPAPYSTWGDALDSMIGARAIQGLRISALAQKPKPVQEICPGCEATLGAACGRESCPKGWEAAPPQRKPLTQEEIEQEYKKGYADGYAAGYDNGDSEGFTRGTDSMVPASLAAWRAETKPLTEAQIYAAIKGIDSLKAVEVARAIERAHGIKE